MNDLTNAAAAAGAIDAGDLLKLLDPEAIKRDAKGAVTNAAELIADLKKAKPHLFGKRAREMSDDEYLAAAAKLGIRRSFRNSLGRR